MRVSKALPRDEVRALVAPVYMGLIKELDDQMGRLFKYLKESGRLDDTMIVFCSDHGDNNEVIIGWVRKIDHDCSARIPMIVYDPRKEADLTRGTVNDALVEGIDLTPTFIELMGGDKKPHILEGRSLQPLLFGEPSQWREFAVSEYDYSTRDARRAINVDQNDARLTMIFDSRWKYVHVEHMRPLLFDLQNDPDELGDLATIPPFPLKLNG